MKFKDNAFYKAFELIKKNDNFKYKRTEGDSTYYYDIEVGVALILYKLLNLHLNNGVYEDVEIKFKKSHPTCDTLPDIYSPTDALEVLKDKELKDIDEISFVNEGETFYNSSSFYIHEDKEEIELFESSWEDERYVDW